MKISKFILMQFCFLKKHLGLQFNFHLLNKLSLVYDKSDQHQTIYDSYGAEVAATQA